MADNLDELKQLVIDGKLVPFGTVRDAFITAAEHPDPPQPGDIMPGRYVVVSVEPAPEGVGWNLKVKRLVPPRTIQR